MQNLKEWLNTETLEYKQAACMYGHSKWVRIPNEAVAFIEQKKVWRGFIEDMSHVGCGVILWQREQDEPFLTPECTLNDQYAEIEEVRQHSHYFKDVSNLSEIDVYMVLKLFNVTDPCLQHIAKKALCAGQRGHKNFNRDLKDILDTAKRAVEINNG